MVCIVVCHVVPGSPTGVNVLRLNGTHMNVSWNQIPLSEAGGFIVTYRVFYNQIATERRRRHVIVNFPVPGNETNALIGGLDPPSTYEVYVSAATSAGEGEYSIIPVVARSNFLTIILFTTCMWCLIMHFCIVCINLCEIMLVSCQEFVKCGNI